MCMLVQIDKMLLSDASISNEHLHPKISGQNRFNTHQQTSSYIVV